MNTLLDEKTSIVESLSEDQAVEIVKKALESAGIPYEERPDTRPTPPSFLDPADFYDTPKKRCIEAVRLEGKSATDDTDWMIRHFVQGNTGAYFTAVYETAKVSTSPSRDSRTKKKAARRLEMK